MARYTIKYRTGDTDAIEADEIFRKEDEYRALAGTPGNVTVIAHIPFDSVLSIIRQDEAVTD